MINHSVGSSFLLCLLSLGENKVRKVGQPSQMCFECNVHQLVVVNKPMCLYCVWMTRMIIMYCGGCACCCSVWRGKGDLFKRLLRAHVLAKLTADVLD